MKYILFISLVPILFFSSCNNEEEYKLYLNQINEINESKQIVNDNLNKYFLRIETFVKSIYSTSPKKIKPWYDKDIQLINASDSLINFIDSIDKIIIHNNYTKENLQQIDNIEKADVILIEKNINKYVNKMEHLFNDVYDSDDVIKSMKNNLKIEHSLFKKKTNIYKLHTLLLFLQYSILKVKSDFLELVASQVDGHYNSNNYPYLVIVPEKKIIKKGETFGADIKICGTKEAYLPFYIEGKKLKKDKNGLYFFKEKATGKPRKVSKDGYMLIYNYALQDTVKFPFKLEYEIIAR